MNGIEQIKSEINEVTNAIDELTLKKKDLLVSLCHFTQNRFEELKNVKPGDEIANTAGFKFFYKGVELNYLNEIVVICNLVKKDGTASQKTKMLPLHKFGVRI